MQNINFPLKVQLAGDSIWDYDGPTTVTVSDIEVEGDADDYRLVSVTHDTDWRIYTDTGFEKAISAAVGFDVDWTEQGMQDNGRATLEKKRLTL